MRRVASGLVAVLGLLWVVAALVMCGQQGIDQPKGKPVPGKTIEAVLKKHTGSLMALPGVVGTAQGECAGKPCIKVFVVKKSADLLKQIPTVIEGYAVEVQETGEIRAVDPS